MRRQSCAGSLRPARPNRENNPFGAAGLEGTLGTEQAMINKVIEDSLKS